MPPKFVADAVTKNSGAGNHNDENPGMEKPLLREESSRQHQALARHDESQQHLALQRHTHKDDQVTPMSELACKGNQLIEHNPASPP